VTKLNKSRQWGQGTKAMIDKRLIIRLLCVALVAAVMLPFVHVLFPYVSNVLSGTQFQAFEAVISATIGFGLSAIVG
jgi:hypothetical protein